MFNLWSLEELKKPEDGAIYIHTIFIQYSVDAPHYKKVYNAFTENRLKFSGSGDSLSVRGKLSVRISGIQYVYDILQIPELYHLGSLSDPWYTCIYSLVIPVVVSAAVH